MLAFRNNGFFVTYTNDAAASVGRSALVSITACFTGSSAECWSIARALEAMKTVNACAIALQLRVKHAQRLINAFQIERVPGRGYVLAAGKP